LVDQLEYEQEINNLRQTFILIFSLIVFSSCENSEENIKNFIDLENLSVEQLTNSEIIYTENGHLKVKVKSNSMERLSDKEEIIELSGGVHFDFYKLNSSKKNSVPTSVLSCNRATINNTTNIMIAKGDVYCHIGDKIILTEELIWDKNRKVRYFYDDSDTNKARKYDNVDFIYSDYKVIKIHDSDTMYFSSFRCTSDFGENRTINGETFKSPVVFGKTRGISEAIISTPLKEN